MNENLDLTKILDGCPKGTEFYSTTYGMVEFIRLDLSSIYPILVSLTSSGVGCFTKDGRIFSSYYGECTLFPSKDQRDWSKFERFWDKSKVERFDVNTLQPFDKVLVRGQNGQNWRAELFSHVDNVFRMVAVGSCYWAQCIPYNEDTKHLLGTTNDCPEYFKWWEE